MAKFVPDSSTLNLDNVTKIESTDRVVASFVNGYYQTFIDNMANLHATDDRIQHVVPIELTVAGWTGTNPPFTQEKSVAGVTANDTATVSLKYPSTVTTWAAKKAMDKEARYVYKCVTGAGTVTFYAVQRPNAVLTFELRGI